MISNIGQMSLGLAIVVAVCALFFTVLSLRERTTRYDGFVRGSIALLALLFSVASAALLYALVKSDFRLDYVVNYTERALPLGYKYAAFWAGQSGSLLLWGWLLCVLCLVAVWVRRKDRGPEHTVAGGVMAAACGFFAILLLFVDQANPFLPVQLDVVPPDGYGLNPQLQDPGMIIHPPLLFLGYAGYTIPFAIMIGALVAGRSDNHWLALVRRWVLFAWIMLTAGIVLGAWWAYVELGWGGYWAWDPVENASLLPWFTGTALLHSIVVQQHRGMFKIWNVYLIAASFLLCIFGTYLTRSGVIASVHAFPESAIGQLFLGFMVLCMVGGLALLIWRRKLLRSEHQIEGFVSREGAFLLGNTLLVIMMLTTLLGTIFPLISSLFGREITPDRSFYDKIVAPMGMVLAFIMAHGPVLAFGKSAAKKIVRDMTFPGIAGVIGLIIAMKIVWPGAESWGVYQSFLGTSMSELTPEEATRFLTAKGEMIAFLVMPICTFIATLGTFAVIVSFVRVVSARQRSTGEVWPMAAIRMIDADKRRYGAQITHLGVMLIIMGVAASSLFDDRHEVVLDLGESASVGSYTATLDSVDPIDEANYFGAQATVSVADADGNPLSTVLPQKRIYKNPRWRGQPNTEVAIHSTLHRDVYVILAGVDKRDGQDIAGLQVIIAPLVLWIWLGGVVMALGGFFCMLPRFLPHARRATAPAAAVSLEESRSEQDG